MNGTKKSIISISNHMKGIRVVNTSMENYRGCFITYQEGACYFFQCCGFLKSQYFGGDISPASKRFFITKLFIPSYKKFLELRQTLCSIEVEAIYETSLQLLKRNIESINNSMSSLLNELNKM
jgi:hypothetical protein